MDHIRTASSTDELHALVDDLLNELTLDEKVSLLHSSQPAIGRLGMKPFNTGGEAVHGVAWLDDATQFPQPPGLAATWDADLLRRVGEATGRELRVKHREGKTHLNCWAPVVNPLRNPLWGRNEEGYSEDPWLTSDMAIAFAQGLRGDHPLYWRTLPTLKHLLGYNNETDRCTSSSDLSPRDLHEYELPAFLGPLASGAIAGVMPAYNLVNGRPVHTDADLYDAIRDVHPDVIAVSDAYAGMNLHQAERYFSDIGAGHAGAINAGLDSFTEGESNAQPTLDAIHDALDRGLLTEDAITQAARRLLFARALTGEFDPEGGPFADEPGQVIDSAEHRELAREAATKQVTLLTNDGLLPLSAGTKVAVIGPMAQTVLQDWYSGTPTYTVSIADAAAEVFDAVADSGRDRVRFVTEDGRSLDMAEDGIVLAGYDEGAVFEIENWGNNVHTIHDLTTGLLWSGKDWWGITATSPRPHGWFCHEAFRIVPNDDSGTVSLMHRATRMWVRVEPFSGVASMSAETLDQATKFTMDVVSRGADRVAELVKDADVAIVAMGNEPHIHGRETEDRTTLEFPDGHKDLWNTVAASSQASVLVVVSSYPYAVGALIEKANASIWTSHAGQELGHAVIDVISGAAEPAGRIAQTWWASDDDIPDVLDYQLRESEQLSWYSKATPTFAIGHGLTYSQVSHDGLRLEGSVAGDDLFAHVTMTNHGDRTARELALISADGGVEWGVRPVGWARVELEPGSTTEVAVAVPAERLRQWSQRHDQWTWPAEGWELFAGPTVLDRTISEQLDAPDQPPELRGFPLEAWKADSRETVVGIPRDELSGTAVAGRPGGSVTWTKTEPAERLIVRARSAKQGRSAVQPSPATITLTTSGGANHQLILDPETTTWSDHAIDLGLTEGEDLTAALDGAAELDWVTRA